MNLKCRYNEISLFLQQTYDFFPYDILSAVLNGTGSCRMIVQLTYVPWGARPKNIQDIARPSSDSGSITWREERCARCSHVSTATVLSIPSKQWDINRTVWRPSNDAQDFRRLSPCEKDLSWVTVQCSKSATFDSAAEHSDATLQII